MPPMNDQKGPAVKFPPPLIFFGFMMVAIFIQRNYPVVLPRFVFLEIVGGLMMLASIALGVAALLSIKKAGTHLEPWKPTSAIVDSGVFSLSRNPMYVAMSLLDFSYGLIQGNVWVMLSVVPAAFTVYLVAIRKEEAYLEQKFGEEYLAYKSRVRRWL